MRWLWRSVLISVAVLWLPVTMHCHLESLTQLQILNCCAHSEDPHQDNDCDGDGCADVESGLYECKYQPMEVAAPLLGPVESFTVLVELRETPVKSSFDVLETAPPELRNGWQFSLRSALCPRAPTLLT